MVLFGPEGLEHAANALLSSLTGPTHVAVQTTRGVRDISDGPVHTHREGLTIEISPGGLDDIDIFNMAVPEIMTLGRADTARNVTKMMADDLPVDLSPRESGAEVVLIKYLSFYGLSSEIRKLNAICKRHPTMKIVAVVCDCDIHAKQRALSILEDRAHAHAVIVGDCGGRHSLQKLLRHIINHWKLPAP